MLVVDGKDAISRSDDEDELIFDHTTLLNKEISFRELSNKLYQNGCKLQVARTINLCFSFFGLGLCFAIPTATLEDLQRSTGAGLDIRHIYTARYTGYLFGSLLGGYLFDRYNRQFLLFLSLLATSIGVIVMPFCANVASLMACTTITGITMGFLDTGGNVWCLDLWGRRSAPVMQTLHFCFGLGAFVAPLVAEPFLSPLNVNTSTALTDGAAGNLNTSHPFPYMKFLHSGSSIKHLVNREAISYDTFEVDLSKFDHVLAKRSDDTNSTGAMTSENITATEQDITTQNPNSTINTTLSKVAVTTGRTFKPKPQYADGNQLKEKDKWDRKSNKVIPTAAPVTIPKTSTSTVIHNNNSTENFASLNGENATVSNDYNTSSSNIDHSVNSTSNTSVPVLVNDYSTISSSINDTHDNNTNGMAAGLNITEENSLFFNETETGTVETETKGNLSLKLHLTNISNDDLNITNATMGLNTSDSTHDEVVGSVAISKQITLSTPFVTQSELTATTPASISESDKVAVLPSVDLKKIQTGNIEKGSTGSMVLDHPVETVQPHLENSSEAVQKNENETRKEQEKSSTVNKEREKSAKYASQNTTGKNRKMLKVSKMKNDKANTTNTSDISIASVNKTEITDVKHFPGNEMHDQQDASLGTAMPKEILSSYNRKPIGGKNVSAPLSDQKYSNAQSTLASFEGKAKAIELTTPRTTTSLQKEGISTFVTDIPVSTTVGVDGKKFKETLGTLGVDEVNPAEEDRDLVGVNRVKNSNGISPQDGENFSDIIDPNESKSHHLDALSDIFNALRKNRLGKFEIAYVILGLYVFLVSIVFLVFLCKNPREPRSRQLEELNKTRETSQRFTFTMVGLLSLFLCLYVGIEVAVGEVLHTFASKESLQLSTASGYFLSYLFWGSFAISRFFTIIISMKFSGFCILLTNLTICLIASIMLVAGADKIEAILWLGTVILGLGVGPLFPTSIAWIERYIYVTNKTASVFILGAALGEIVIPIIINTFINQEPMVLMYMNIVVNALCFVSFVVLSVLAFRHGDKYLKKPKRFLYHLANTDDTEDATELITNSFSNSNGTEAGVKQRYRKISK